MSEFLIYVVLPVAAGGVLFVILWYFLSSYKYKDLPHAIAKGFLPMYNDVLKWDTDVKCPEHCPLAVHCHPMVQNERNENCYHKLCTLTVIKAGLITMKDITGRRTHARKNSKRNL